MIDEPVRLPTRPADPAPAPFPVIASVAPLVVSGVIWAITGSAFVLLFAALGPVIAVASLLDGRRSNRRNQKKDAAEYQHALDAAWTSVAERHSAERSAAWQRQPRASRIVAETDVDSPPWPPGSGTSVSIGSGSIRSSIRLEGGRPDDEPELWAQATTLNDAPIIADAGAGIGIVGPSELTRGVARGILIQLARAVPPGRLSFEVHGASWAWVGALPYNGQEPAGQQIAVVERDLNGGGPLLPGQPVIALSHSVAGLPAGCATILQLHGSRAAEVVRSPHYEAGLRLTPDLIGSAEAARFAERLHRQAAEAGLLGYAEALPASIPFAALRPATVDPPVDRSQRQTATSLACVIGVGLHGAVTVDLAASGPHAVVGGTTGSGKSELLVTWITALASTLPPSQVTFLLVDFKGGAAFSALRVLPHCVGLITDLAEGEAARALASLKAEIRFRERVFRDAGARDVSDPQLAGALPRLVIVVDEFQAMLDTFPQLHTLFVDIAARGRSLGIHLILCTQRPAGVVRDALLANCSLRISLRVNNRADSQAVIGADDAAAISASTPGRCIIENGVGGLTAFQVATCTTADIRHVADQTPVGALVRRPWLDPLPATITAADVAAVDAVERTVGGAVGGSADRDEAGFRLGIIDDPEHQRYRVARWDPASDGHLLVIGGAGSGKSGLVRSLASQCHAVGEAGESIVSGPEIVSGLQIVSGPEEVWDTLVRAQSARLGSSARLELLLLDDFDAAYAQWDLDYQLAAADLLAGLLRGRGAHAMVVTVQRLTSAVKPIAALFPRRMLLGVPNRDEHLAAGGLPELFDPAMPPGGGSWDGLRFQLLGPELEPVSIGASPAQLALPRDTGPLVVVTSAPVRTLDRLASRWPDRAVVDLSAPGDARVQIDVPQASVDTVFLGDPDAWQANWTLLGTLRRSCGIVFDGCSLADYRSISRRRELPPPLSRGGDKVWLLQPDGTAIRAEL
ncbi:FtsK/SpoIIIE domain-containing protein [Glaciibacter superstes]|uniref:FtsK/SpoIIIE domain-containing protein n=1 Tax=Glaciibacter superstes TaxID=501023 RepID=UPI0003B5AA0A|nr:FtsK/SpoIIIE domain-containing protein [Glaciibacter superstes]